MSFPSVSKIRSCRSFPLRQLQMHIFSCFHSPVPYLYPCIVFCPLCTLPMPLPMLMITFPVLSVNVKVYSLKELRVLSPAAYPKHSPPAGCAASPCAASDVFSCVVPCVFCCGTSDGCSCVASGVSDIPCPFSCEDDGTSVALPCGVSGVSVTFSCGVSPFSAGVSPCAFPSSVAASSASVPRKKHPESAYRAENPAIPVLHVPAP